MGYWLLTACTLAALVYANTLNGTFVYDDRRAVLSNQDINTENPSASLWSNDFWGTPLASAASHGSYRPVSVLTYRWNHWISGYNPWSYHLVNVILHVVVTALLYHLGTLLLSETGAGLAAVLFAVHPIHTEAVASIVGRADILAGVFLLLSAISYIHYRRRCDDSDDESLRKSRSPGANGCKKTRRSCDKSAHRRLSGVAGNLAKWALLASTICTATISLFCKELGFAALPVCIVYELLVMARMKIVKLDAKLRWTNVLILSTCASALIAVRVKLGNFTVPTFSSADNPIIKSNFSTRVLTFAYLPVFNFFLTLFPFSLSFDWSMDSIPKITSFFDYRNILSITFYLISQVLVRAIFRSFVSHAVKHDPVCRRRREYSCLCKHVVGQRSLTPPAVALFLLALSVIPFIPATNLFFYVGFVVAERILYVPSIGLCLLVGHCYDNVGARRRTLFAVAFALSATLFCVRSVLRNQDWQTEEKLYRSNIHINPPKAYGNLGSILSSEGRLEEAETALRKALQYRYTMADAHYNLALLLEETSRPEEAILRYNAAIKYRPSLISAYLKLAQLLRTKHRDFEAIEVLNKGLSVDISRTKDIKVNELARVQSLVNLAAIYTDAGDLIKGLTAYVEAVATAPPYYKPQALFVYIGETLMKMRNYEDAELWYQYITGDVKIQPNDIIGMKSFANCSTITKNKWVKAMEAFNFKDPQLYLQYSQLLIDDGRYRKAVDILNKVIETRPQDGALIHRTARICRLAGFLREAEYYYNKLVLVDPRASSYEELAAVLKTLGKREQADDAYGYSEKLRRRDAVAARSSLPNCDMMAKNCDTNDTKDVSD